MIEIYLVIAFAHMAWAIYRTTDIWKNGPEDESQKKFIEEANDIPKSIMGISIFLGAVITGLLWPFFLFNHGMSYLIKKSKNGLK